MGVVIALTGVTTITIYYYYLASQPTSSGGLGIFNQPVGVQQQLNLQKEEELKAQLAIKAPGLFGDERDQVLVKFNMLQACCGTGRGLVSYNGQLQAVQFTTDNRVCRFKVSMIISRSCDPVPCCHVTSCTSQTICYNRLPTLKNEDGLVSLQFKKKDSQLLAEQSTICAHLQAIVSNPSIQVMVESIRPLPDDW